MYKTYGSKFGVIMITIAAAALYAIPIVLILPATNLTFKTIRDDQFFFILYAILIVFIFVDLLIQYIHINSNPEISTLKRI